MWNIRPSKPAAIFGACFGVALIVWGAVQLAGTDNHGFLILWILAGVGIIAFNLWAAFSRRGAVEQVTPVEGRDDEGAREPKA